MAIVASTPHSGSHFLANLLNLPFRHYYKGEIADLEREDWIFTPLRNPYAQARSWKKRGKSVLPDDTARESLTQMWDSLLRLRRTPVFLPLDTGSRDEHLRVIEHVLRREISTDWAPLNHEPGHVTLTDDEMRAIKQYMPFFARFGYD